MAKPRIGLIVGSTREGRFADKPAEWIKDIAASRNDVEIEVVDLKDYPLPFLGEPGADTATDAARRWKEKVDSLDGFIVTVAEYNHGPAAVLKNALDHAHGEWNRKPVAFVGYGGVGGARAVEQLRLHAVELQMAPTRTAVHILWPDMVAAQKGEKRLAEMEHLNKGAADTLDQLVWWARALKAARDRDVVQAKAA